MTEKTKTKRVIRSSPRGTFLHAHLNTPDKGPPGKDATPKYKTKLVVEPGKAPVDAEIAFIEAAVDAQMELAKAELPKTKHSGLIRRSPVKDHFDKQGNETGKKVIEYSSIAEYFNKKTQKTVSNKPAIFNKAGKPEDIMIFTGTEGKVSYYIDAYTNGQNVGVTLRVVAAKVLAERDAMSPKDADYYGFAPEDDEDGDDAAPASDSSEGSSDGHAF